MSIKTSGKVHAAGLALPSNGEITVGGQKLNLSATELGYVDGVTAGTAAASKAVVLDASKDVSGIRNLSMTGTGTIGGRLALGTGGTLNLEKVTVDASAGGSAQSAAIASLADGAVILDVVVKITEAFDGDTTKTVEVGVSGGDTALLIDPADVDTTTLNTTINMYNSGTAGLVSPYIFTAASDIVATWTNTASASTGSFEVCILWAEFGLSADA